MANNSGWIQIQAVLSDSTGNTPYYLTLYPAGIILTNTPADGVSRWR